MTIQIKAGVIHQIQKEQYATEEQASLKLQENLHAVNNHLFSFVKYAEEQLEKSGKNHSVSGGFAIEHTLSKILSDSYFNQTGQLDYLTLSQQITKGLFEFVKRKPFTSGGYLPIIFYSEGDVDYLLISSISLNKYININEKGEFSNTDAIDNEALKVGLKIDLTAMTKHHNNQGETPADSYVKWVQRSKSGLPDYIQDFIPVSQRIDDSKATKSFLTYFQEYAETVFEDENVRSKVQSDVYTLMRTKADKNEPIHIEEDIDPLLESALKTYGIENKPKFNEFRQEKKVSLDSSFHVDNNKLAKVENFALSFSETGITVKGKVAELGSSIKAFSDPQTGKKYLQIEMSDDEFNTITARYKSLSE